MSLYCAALVDFSIVLLISAKSLVLLKNYVKILKLAADPVPETGNPQTASFIHGTVFYLIAELSMLARFLW